MNDCHFIMAALAPAIHAAPFGRPARLDTWRNPVDHRVKTGDAGFTGHDGFASGDGGVPA